MAINYEEKRQQNQEQVNYDYFAHDENQQEQGFFEKYKPETPDDKKRKKAASELINPVPPTNSTSLPCSFVMSATVFSARSLYSDTLNASYGSHISKR